MRWAFVLITVCGCGPGPGVFPLSDNFINSYAVVDEEGVIVVDTHEVGREHWLADRLEYLGIEPEDVSLIVLTHGHGDHAGSAAALRDLIGAPIAVGAGDVPMVEAGEIGTLTPTGFLGRSRLRRGKVHREFPAFSPDLVVDGELDLTPFGVAARAVLTPGGHTPGSLVVELDDGQVLVGDLVRSGFVFRGRPAEHLYQDDANLVHEQLSEILDRGATWLWPGHGGALKARRVRRWLKRQ